MTTITLNSIFSKIISSEKLTSKNVVSHINKLSMKEKQFLDNFGRYDKLIEKIDSYFDKKEEKRINDIIKGKAKLLNVSLKKMNQLIDKASQIAMCFSAGYSMGGVIEVSCISKDGSELLATRDTTEVYAKSSNYKAKHGFNSIKLTVKELDSIELIGGLPTIKGEEVAPKVFKCKVLIGTGSKHTYKIIWNDMFITSNYHGKSIDDCVNWRKKQAERLILNRNKLINIEKIKNKFIGFQHSLKVGNCINGTKAFIQRHNLNPDFGYTIRYIMSLEDSIFTRRLLNI